MDLCDIACRELYNRRFPFVGLVGTYQNGDPGGCTFSEGARKVRNFISSYFPPIRKWEMAISHEDDHLAKL